ncbi:MFS transporter, UMF1 family [Microbulbifer donghaiensis]|uniref:MFS transporter, UMF1 family n=1 Tax=Microbulbifer donghaiensis TaxID=494016 RepID=A0A1M4Z6N2_9GAMM|nr:MFS transporter [Microbulbifer donghaiensis]SHF13645.1 MFS transporter, UMF1 family [Microbulbifer donghaiensis]
MDTAKEKGEATETTGRRAVWSWAFYDWANSAFATVVLAGFFPLLYQDFWNAGVDAETANLRLGWANAAASLVIALGAPLIGALADRAGARKRLLLLFAVPGMLATALLAGVPGGAWLAASLLFVCASVGFLGSNLLYDALLTSVAPPARWHAVSGLGFGLGYLGGGLLYIGCVAAALKPAAFGFADTTSAALAAFAMTALWWALFSLPLVLWVREPPATASTAGGSLLRQTLRELRTTIGHLRHYRTVMVFLFAYWLYIDGVGTVIRMAVAYGRALGFERSHLILALLLVQFVGFPAAILFARLGERIGPQRGIYIGLAVYILVCVWGAFIRAPWEFYAIAVLIGLVQGGVQALSRSCYARLIPTARSGEFFGFYNLMGKFAALIGPPLFGLFGSWFGDVRYSMLALILLFVAGGLILSRVPAAAFTAGAEPSAE